MKLLIKRWMPSSVWKRLRATKHCIARIIRILFEKCGLIIARRNDYYSPLPSEFALRKTYSRWAKPSGMRGVAYDLDAMKQHLLSLIHGYYPGFASLQSYDSLLSAGYGPGYTHVDAFALYAKIRELQPRRYIEIGSGLSTYYCNLARQDNLKEGKQDTEIVCIEPYPFRKLHEIKNIRLIQEAVQNVPLETFSALREGDVLFIDSSHVVRIDGDVPYIFLEILPSLAPGVHIHIHDIPFPFNIPYPPDYWTLLQHPQSLHWPMYWNEAMLLQAFLAFNPSFKITLSCPLLRHFDEDFCRKHLPIYKSIVEEPNTFSSIWLKRVS